MTIDPDYIDTAVIRDMYAQGGKTIGPLVAKMLDLIDQWDEEGASSESDAYDIVAEALAAKLDELADKIRSSEEIRPWELSEDGCEYATVLAGSEKDARAIGREQVEMDGDQTETVWVDVRVHCPLTEEESAAIVQCDPDEPDCAEDEHDWQDPIRVVGGCKESPGIFGHGGGVIITTVCRYCGVYHVTDTWAQHPGTGAQGLESVKYTDADDVSLAYVLRERLHERYEALTDAEADRLEAALMEVLGVDAIHQVIPDNITTPLNTISDVAGALADITEAMAGMADEEIDYD